MAPARRARLPAAHRPAVPLAERRLCIFDAFLGSARLAQTQGHQARAQGCACKRHQGRLAYRPRPHRSGWDAFFDFYMEPARANGGVPIYALVLTPWSAEHGRPHLLVMAKRAADGSPAPSTSSAPTRSSAGTGARSSTTRSCISRSATIRPSNSRSSTSSIASKRARKASTSRARLPTKHHMSAHYIVDPSLRRAVADFLKHEREFVAEEIEEFKEMAPFRKA